MSGHFQSRRTSESGNVLFLILIAVALFAALSYAVTQSSRSGAGDASSEKSLVSSSVLTEYPAGVRTAIMRMIVSSSITPDQLLFDPPSTGMITSANQKYAVFLPGVGGGASYQLASPDLMASGGQGTWHFNALNQVANIGTTGTGSDTSGQDVMAFLYGVAKGICTKLDAQLGIGTIPSIAFTASNATTDQNVTGSAGSLANGFPASASTALFTGTALAGQPYGCFQNSNDSAYVYYHVVIER